MRRNRLVMVVMAATAVAVLAGCSSYPTKLGVLHPGHITREHGKPMEGGYYQNFDPDAAVLEVGPAEDTNPVMTQHVLIATVKNAKGKPLDSRRVEWMIAEGGVGAIVEVDESGWYGTRGYKVDNKYAISHTNRGDHVITRGNSDPTDDIKIGKGQTWCVITSPIEGDTNVVVYAPGIFNWDKHKVFAVKHWLDAAWQFPPNATNAVGTDHAMAVKVMKNSDKTPYEGWVVNFKLTGGPDAVFVPGNKTTASVKTDAAGMAKVALKQVKAVEGANTVAMEIIRPGDKACCKPPARVASGTMTKTWVGPRIGIRKSGTARAGVGDQVAYSITVTNPGKAAAANVRVSDELPAGLTYVSSSPAGRASGQKIAWSLGSLAPGASRSISLKAKATKTGTFENCANVVADHGLKASDCAKTIVTAPKLALEKTGPAEVLICEPITYTITVRNNGDGPATNVKINEELPDGLVAVVDGRETKSIVGNVGTLQPGKSARITLNAKAKKAGRFTNKATATADRGLKAEATHTVIVKQPVLVLSKTGPAKRFLGRNAAFEISVKNSGDGEARGVIVVDMLPAGMTFVSASDGGRFAAGKITWSLGTMAPGASKKLSVVAKANRAGTLTNSVTATAKCTKASANTRIAITGIPAILLETVDLTDPIEIGTNTTYRITVTNQGSADGTGIKIVATLPAEQSYVSSTGSTKATVVGKVVTFAPLPRLAPKAKAVFNVTVKGVKTGDVRFKVELNSDQMTSPVNETESTHIYE
jgi:uncharacterized repeat protein (TIGR01451 family)